MSDAFQIRPATDEDVGFIVDSWRRSFERHSSIFAASPEGYRVFMHRYIARLMREPNACARVAIDSNDASVILGYAIASGDELHYVYVRSELRKNGIAKALLTSIKPAKYTAKTDNFMSRIKPTQREWAFQARYTL